MHALVTAIFFRMTRVDAFLADTELFPPDTKLRQAVTAALALADEFSLRSLALPAISTGIYGFPKNRAARVLFEALADYFASHPDSGLETVEIVLYDQPTWEAFVDAYRTRWKGTSEA